MSFIIKLLSSPITEALGWTLLHSFWFGFLCFGITWITLRFIPSRMSDLRYIVATVGLLFILFSSAFIFNLMLPSVSTAPALVTDNTLFQIAAYQVPQATASVSPGVISTITGVIKANMSLIVFVWVVGALLTSLKVFGGYWYVTKIRSSSEVINGEWETRIQRLADRLGVYRYVVLAESALIQAPVVMGFIKPMILVPVGMMSGLTTEQLETVFIHELMHIRRGDYLVNIVQSFLEAIFFFNPFVWILSDVMRREREHCCDDAVVELHGNPLVYVKALASLEEARLTRAGVALSLAEDKNQLLKRIKRIMEKSVQRYSGREKLVPAVLLVLGLMCASWLTIQTEKRSQQTSQDGNTVSENVQEFKQVNLSSDTTIKDKSGNKKTIIRIHDNGDSETFEVYDDDDDDDDNDMHFMMPGMSMHMDPIPPIPPIDMDFHFEMPEMPEIEAMDFNMAPLAPMEPIDVHVSVPAMPAIAPMDFDFSHIMFDTLGPHNWKNSRDWEEFGKEFEKSFRERFEGFYEQHEEEMEEMMERLEEKFNREHNDIDEDNDHDNDREEWGAARERQSRELKGQIDMLQSQSEALANQNFKIREQNQKIRSANSEAADIARKVDGHAAIQAQKARDARGMAVSVAGMKSREFENAKAALADAQKMKISSDKWAQDWTKRVEDSQRIAKKELVKDGYLKDSDDINTVNINNDDVTINGIKIKSKDQEKYKKLLRVDMSNSGRME